MRLKTILWQSNFIRSCPKQTFKFVSPMRLILWSGKPGKFQAHPQRNPFRLIRCAIKNPYFIVRINQTINLKLVTDKKNMNHRRFVSEINECSIFMFAFRSNERGYCFSVLNRHYKGTNQCVLFVSCQTFDKFIHSSLLTTISNQQ